MVKNKNLVLEQKRICGLFRILTRRYGPQGWWPLRSRRITAGANIGQTYGFNSNGYHPGFVHSPEGNDIFEIAAGAVLTQNTSWSNAATALDALIDSGRLTPEAVAAMKNESLAEIIKSSGYYNQKALKLKALAGMFLESSEEPERDDLLAVRGIGPETADSILLYAYGKPVFVIDAYTRRILARFTGVDEIETTGYEELRSAVEDVFPDDLEARREYHALLVYHAKTYCRKHPLCTTGCPAMIACKKRKCLQKS